MKIVAGNNFCYVKDAIMSGSTVTRLHNISVGVSIHPTYQLFSFGCDVNTTYAHYGDVIVVRAVRSIKKGESFIHSEYDYAHLPYQERLDRSLTMRFEKCHCVPCVNQWPAIDELRDVDQKFKCPNCGEEIGTTLRLARDCVKCGQDLTNVLRNCELSLEQLSELSEHVGQRSLSEQHVAVCAKLIKQLEQFVIRPSYWLYQAERMLGRFMMDGGNAYCRKDGTSSGMIKPEPRMFDMPDIFNSLETVE
jgi:predicted RNA-binding Zn-ribbon protein involved in translation (DUF1610 family)